MSRNDEAEMGNKGGSGWLGRPIQGLTGEAHAGVPADTHTITSPQNNCNPQFFLVPLAKCQQQKKRKKKEKGNLAKGEETQSTPDAKTFSQQSQEHNGQFKEAVTDRE